MTHTNESIPWTPSKIDLPFNEWVPDMLATMFAMQRKHLRVYESDGGHVADSGTKHLDLALVGDLSQRTVHEFYRRVMGYAVEEIMEGVGLFKGKPWKRNFEAPDRAQVMDEVADALHFFFEALLAIGCTAEELFEAYFKTSDKNVQRQNGDY